MDSPDRRPMFKSGPKGSKNTGVSVSDLILESAREKLKTEPHKVGKSVSQLVEYLLWQYVGSPPDLVVGTETSEE